MESGELVARFIATTAQLDKLQGTLFEHARQQERLEQRYNTLENLTRELISFLLATPVQLTAEWQIQRDALVTRILPFIRNQEAR
jgi:hypothetical protein